MISRKALDGRAAGIMVLLCAIWGMQQIAVKAAAPDMTPMLQMALRSAPAAVFIGFYLRKKGLGLLPGNGKWLAGLAAGTLFTLEYLLVAEGLLLTTASHMVMMLYTAPAFAALGLHYFIPEERLRPVQWGGMALAFCGVVVAFYDTGASADAIYSQMLFGDTLGLLAGVSWGATTVIVRTKLSETPSAQTAFMQLLTCFCLLLPCSALTGRLGFSLTGIVWASLGFQIVMVCIVSMLLWFWLLTVYPASQLGVLSFLTPMFGIAFGVLLLDEIVEPKFVLGAALILAGIAIVSGWQWFSRHFFQKP